MEDDCETQNKDGPEILFGQARVSKNRRNSSVKQRPKRRTRERRMLQVGKKGSIGGRTTGYASDDKASATLAYKQHSQSVQNTVRERTRGPKTGGGEPLKIKAEVGRVRARTRGHKASGPKKI